MMPRTPALRLRRAAPHVLEAVEKFSEINVQGKSEPSHEIEAWIALAGFEARDVRPVDRSEMRKTLLGQAQAMSVRPHSVAELDLPRRSAFVRPAHQGKLDA